MTLDSDEGIGKSPPEGFPHDPDDHSEINGNIDIDNNNDVDKIRSILSNSSGNTANGIGVVGRLQKTIEKITLNCEFGSSYDHIEVSLDEIIDGSGSEIEDLFDNNQYSFGFEAEARDQCRMKTISETFSLPCTSSYSEIRNNMETSGAILRLEPSNCGALTLEETDSLGLLPMPISMDLNIELPSALPSSIPSIEPDPEPETTEDNHNNNNDNGSKSNFEPIQLEFPEVTHTLPDCDLRNFVPRILPSGRIIRKVCKSVFSRTRAQQVTCLVQPKVPTHRNLNEYFNHLKTLAKTNPDVLKLIKKT